MPPPPPQVVSPEEAVGRAGRIKTAGSQVGLRAARRVGRGRGRELMSRHKAITRWVSRLCRAVVCTCVGVVRGSTYIHMYSECVRL